MKKICLVLCGILLTAKFCFAITLLVEREALKKVFPEAGVKVTLEKIKLSAQEVLAAKKALGGKLVHILNAKDSEWINNKTEFDFYFAKKDDKLIAVALILDEPGKWGKIKFIVRINSNFFVEKVLVMRYTESRGRPIAADSFLKQFIGQALNSQFQLNKDIQGVAGATISSDAAYFVVKKALVLTNLVIIRE